MGPPGSGKTTLSKQIAEELNYERFSLDEMGYFSHSELIPHITETLKSGKSVVTDSVYTYSKWRKELLNAISDISCEKVCVVMNTPLDECLRRNAQRPNPLPDFVVESIYKSFEHPTLEEGWDEIIYI